jgi:cytochrome P450
MLAYIIHNPIIHNQINQEVIAVGANFSDVASMPSALSGCRHLSAIYHEVLRLVNSPISLRHVTRTTRTATNKVLRQGNQVMLAHRQLLRDEAVFGAEADSFHPERFLKNEELIKSRSYTPFGGGTRLCPGRFMAKGEIMAFVGLVFNRFELALPQGQAFPIPDLKTGAGMGILAPLEGYDVLVDLTLREKSTPLG